MRRRQFVTLLGGAATTWPLAARARQPAMPVIGYLYSGAPETSANVVAAFRNGLREAGYVEGRNLTIEYCWAHNDNARLPELAADLVRQRMAVRSTLQRRTVSAIHYPAERASAALRAAICALALLTSAWRMRATPTSC